MCGGFFEVFGVELGDGFGVSSDYGGWECEVVEEGRCVEVVCEEWMDLDCSIG